MEKEFIGKSFLHGKSFPRGFFVPAMVSDQKVSGRNISGQKVSDQKVSGRNISTGNISGQKISGRNISDRMFSPETFFLFPGRRYTSLYIAFFQICRYLKFFL